MVRHGGCAKSQYAWFWCIVVAKWLSSTIWNKLGPKKGKFMNNFCRHQLLARSTSTVLTRILTVVAITKSNHGNFDGFVCHFGTSLLMTFQGAVDLPDDLPLVQPSLRFWEWIESIKVSRRKLPTWEPSPDTGKRTQTVVNWLFNLF